MNNTESIGFEITLEGVEENEKRLQELDNRLLSIRKQRAELNKTVSQGKKLSDEEQATLKKLNKEYTNLNRERTDVNKLYKDGLKQTNASRGSMHELGKQLKQNKDLYRSLSKEQRENEEVGGKLLKTIEEQDAQIKELDKSIGDTYRSVGNYEEAIKSAMEGQQAFSGSAGDIVQNFITINESEGGIKSFFQSFTDGIKGATKAGLKFIATPIGAAIAAIVAGITLFTNMLSKNESQADKFGKIWKGVVAIFDSILSVVGNVTEAIVKLIQLDFKGAGQAIEDAYNGATYAINGAYDAAKNLYDLQVEMENMNIRSTTALATLRGELEKQQAVSDDSTKSLKERLTAQQEAVKITKQIAEEEKKLADQQLAVLLKEAEIMANAGEEISREMSQKIADAQAQVLEASYNINNLSANAQREVNQLAQDTLEKNLDILIDGYDNQRTINEKKIADEKRSLEERRAILNETRALGTESFNKQIEEIQQATKEQIDANDLIQTSNAVVLNEKIRQLGLSEILEGRLLEIIRERRIEQSDLAETERDLTDAEVEHAQKLIELARENASVSLEVNRAIIENRKAGIEKELELEDLKSQEILNNYNKRLIDTSQLQDEELQLAIEHNKYINQLKEQELKTHQKAVTDIIANAENERLLAEADRKAYEAETLEEEYDAWLVKMDLDRQIELENEELTQEQKDAIDAKYTQLKKERDKQYYQDKLANTAEYIGAASELNNNLGNAIQSIMDAELAYAGDNEEKKKKIRKKYADLQFATRIGEIGASTALGIINAFSNYPPPNPLGFISAGIIGATGIAQTAKAKAERDKIKKMALGGVTDGASHDYGGSRYYNADGNAVELEGGEGVINKRSMSVPWIRDAASYLNELGGGVSFYKQGGVIPASSPVSGAGAGISIDMDRYAEIIVNGINDKQVLLTDKEVDSHSSKASLVNRISTW